MVTASQGDRRIPPYAGQLELSRAQDEVGDGTTSVIVLAGEAVRCSPFSGTKYAPYHHRQSIQQSVASSTRCLWFYCKDCGHLRSRCIAQGCPRLRRDEVRKPLGRLLCDLALQAVQQVSIDLGNGKKEIDIKRYAKVEKLPVVIWASVRYWTVMFNKDIRTKMRHQSRIRVSCFWIVH